MRISKFVQMVLVVLVGLGAASSSFAQTAHNFEIRFGEPTQRTDGTPFDPATEVGFYAVQCSIDEAFTAPLEVLFERNESIQESAGTRYFLWANAVQVGGWYYCRMNVADVDGLVSNWSAVATVRKVAKPNPPVLRNN